MSESGSKTFARGLQIMEVLRSARGEGLKIADIAALSGVQRTTIYRFLPVLVKHGYVHPATEERVFVFNHARFSEASSLQSAIERLKPVLQRISAQTGDSSFLIRREKGDSVCVHREVGSYPLQVLSVSIGHRQPLGVGSAGLALLSNLAPAEIQDILDINKAKLPKFGGMTRKQMEQLINATVERGWAVVGNAAVPGVLGVGVPILRGPGQPVFAISVSSVLARMPLTRQRFIINLIRKELAAVDLQGLSD